MKDLGQACSFHIVENSTDLQRTSMHPSSIYTTLKVPLTSQKSQTGIFVFKWYTVKDGHLYGVQNAHMKCQI